MKEKGMKVTCDNCGRDIFLHRVEDVVMDGGYSRSEKYEDMPDGWASCYILHKYIILCPDCYKKLKWLITDKAPNIAKIVFEEDIANGCE